MESIEDILKESKQLLDTLNKTENTPSKNVSTIDTFRGELLNFINSQLDPIKRTQQILDLVDAEIVKKLVYHEYDKNELLDVRRELIQATNMRTSVLLDPFKPTNGGGNTLITPPSAESSSNDDILKQLTPDQRGAIDKLTRILASNDKGEKGKKKLVPEDKENEE